MTAARGIASVVSRAADEAQNQASVDLAPRPSGDRRPYLPCRRDENMTVDFAAILQ